MKTRYILFTACCLIVFLIAGCEKNGKAELSASVLSYSDCKNKASETTETTPDTLSCIRYLYEPSTETLRLTHINAGFNCCPSDIRCEASLNNDSLIIRETEQDGLCDCLCLYDIELSIEGLKEQCYQIVFAEPYVRNEMYEIVFEADLALCPEGEVCVVRKAYPWGME